jgi:hypothetical protein
MSEVKPSTKIKFLISGSNLAEPEKKEMYFYLCELEKEHERMRHVLAKFRDELEKIYLPSKP